MKDYDDLLKKTALLVVDMQKYYLDKNSDFYKLPYYLFGVDTNTYIYNRCKEVTIPNIKKLLNYFRKENLKIIFLRLCSMREDKKDLHRFFYRNNDIGKFLNLNNVYPYYKDEMADIIDELKPLENEIVINKTTFSPFSSTNIDKILKRNKIKNLVITGLATSQCVETTARDASDRGYSVILVEDALADYDEQTHIKSLEVSKAVCGGYIYKTKEIKQLLREIIVFIHKKITKNDLLYFTEKE